MTRLAVQSRLVPGDSLREQYDTARRYGFEGLELSGFPMIELAREAIRDKVPVTAMCSGHRGWFIDPDDRSVLLFLPGQQPELLQGSDRLLVLEEIELELTVNQVFEWLKMGV